MSASGERRRSEADAPVRRVLISGGTSGIGRACAERLLAAGHRVWILGSTAESVSSAQESIRPTGATACDVSDALAVDAAISDAAEAMGPLDGVFVNAGIDGGGTSVLDTDVEHFRRVLDVNVIGAFLVARATVRVLSRPGAIVLNASVNALRPEVGFLDYNASKAAVVSIAKSLALELSAQGICVTALCPGYFPTRMTAQYLDDPETRADLVRKIPAGRVGELAEIAALVDYLLSPHAAYMTGSIVSIDGGASV